MLSASLQLRSFSRDFSFDNVSVQFHLDLIHFITDGGGKVVKKAHRTVKPRLCLLDRVRLYQLMWDLYTSGK